MQKMSPHEGMPATKTLIEQSPPPLRKWEVVSMDFVFDLPVTPSGNHGLVFIVDNISHQAHCY
jgi:hypothetical protein